MRLTQAIEQTKAALDSVTSGKWTDAQVAAQLHVQLVSMIRKMTETDEAYHSSVFVILKAAARKVHGGLFAYRMPPWVMKISEVRQYLGSTSFNQGPLIERIGKWGGRGWFHSAVNEITLRGWSDGLDLEFYVAKIPGAATRGTLGSQAGATSAQLMLDPDGAAGDATNFPHEAIADAYMGAVVEITGPASARKGQIRRCVGSSVNQGGSSNQQLLTMESAWSTQPTTADTYEMHLELPGEHTRLLVLLAVRGLLAQERNVEGINVYAQELSEQWSLFANAIKARDVQQPKIIQEFLPTSGEQYSPTTYPWES